MHHRPLVLSPITLVSQENKVRRRGAPRQPLPLLPYSLRMPSLTDEVTEPMARYHPMMTFSQQTTARSRSQPGEALRSGSRWKRNGVEFSKLGERLGESLVGMRPFLEGELTTWGVPRGLLFAWIAHLGPPFRRLRRPPRRPPVAKPPISVTNTLPRPREWPPFRAGAPKSIPEVQSGCDPSSPRKLYRNSPTTSTSS